MNLFFDRKKTLAALVIVTILAAVALWFSFVFPRSKEADEGKPLKQVTDGTPDLSSSKNFSDFISQLSEEQKRCVQNAYGPLYEKLTGPRKDPNFLIPRGEEWRVEEANRCFK